MVFSRKTKGAFALALAGLLTSGCAVDGLLATQATDTNIGYEQANNRMLLLNIVRATQQRPMYFTALKDFNINSKVSGSTGSFTVPFGQAATHQYQIAPSLSAEQTPQVGIDILDDKDFINAVYTPTSAKTLRHFIRQGWPLKVLLHVFVRKIETGDGALINDPDNRYRLDLFTRAVELISRSGKIDKGKTSYDRQGPWIKADKFYESKVVAEIVKQTDSKLEFIECWSMAEFNREMRKLTEQAKKTALRDKWNKSLWKCGGTVSVGSFAPLEISAPLVYEYVPAESGKAGELKKATDAINELVKELNKEIRKSFEDTGQTNAKNRVAEGEAVLKTLLSKTSAKIAVDDPKKPIKLALRSPQGMLYYLGEVARARWRCNNDKLRKDCDRPKVSVTSFRTGKKVGLPLFRLEKGIGGAPVAVAVSYEGERYGIPADGNDDFSMLALTLISQIIDRQKDPKNQVNQPTINLFTN